MTRKSRPAARLNSPDIFHKQILFFVGKGGVGKTTAACSAALTLLDRAERDERIYLFSTDPAHSLADSLGKPVGRRVRQVASHRAARLYACEMDSAAAFEDFKRRYGGVLSEILERGTFLATREIDQFLDLALPGMDEVMALFQLSEIVDAGDYTHIVVDTAPAGHTIRLLELPEVFASWLDALDSLEEKHRFMVIQLTGRHQPDRVAQVLTEFSRKIEAVKSMIGDRSRTAFVMVTNPEHVVREETVRYFQFLQRRQIPVTSLIINRVEPGTKTCDYCRARAAAQAPILKDLARKLSKLAVSRVPLFPGEIRGFDLLRRFRRFAWGAPDRPPTPARMKRGASRVAPRRSVRATSRFDLEPRQILIVGGKGGVGKTTAASALALATAERFPQSAVVVLSTDPAHSLSDALGEHIGEFKKGLAGLPNLDGMEIDSAGRFSAFRHRYESWVDELFASLTAGSRWTIEFDREATRKLLTMAPPGIDEMLGLATIARLLDDQTYRSIVVDTAPSGHLLRLLELPEVALSWVRTLLKLMLEYKQVLHCGDLAKELVSLSKSIKHTLSLLRDSSTTEFLGVAIPEKMSLEETDRLYKQLLRLRIPVHRLLVNSVIPTEPGRRCDFCTARRRQQDEIIRSYHDRFRGLKVFIAPQQLSPIRGPARLRLYFSALTC
jgi:arsenite-transporting ATPase